MPISTFLGLQTTLRGLLAQQRALDVTSHNIANANTEGYSRQQAVMTASQGLQVMPGLTDLASGGSAILGTGVDIAQFLRIRDDFLDAQYRAQAMRLGDARARSSALDRVQLAFAEPSDNGISKQLAHFWDAWSNLANAPESPATRQAAIEQGVTLASSINQLYAQLEAVRQQSRDEFDAITAAGSGEVAMAVKDIVDYTDTIQRQMATGAVPNDLLDKRDALLDKLSQLAQVSVQDLGGGAIKVTFGDAALPLIDQDPVTGAPVSNWPQALTQAAGGKLGALLALSDVPGGEIDSLEADLDTFARELRDAVNYLHNPTGTGVDFFTGTGASDIAVSATAGTVVASLSPDKGANDIALAIAALRYSPSTRPTSPGLTPDQLYAQLVSRVGGAAKDAERTEATAEQLTNAVEDRRQSTSGVSMDEEMANLIRFQRAFQASARAMSSMDEVLDDLINRTGRVGL